jgi:Bacterial EndoU nuclease
MAIDRPSDDEFEEVSRGHQEKPPELGQPYTDNAACGPEIAETRTRTEYYYALRAAVDQQAGASDLTGQSADTQRRSAWDDVTAATRPPLDALRIPPERATHILDGDATGGGHRHGTGSPGKTEFPAHWDDDTILDAISAVAHSPQDVHQQWNQRWKARGEHDKVLVEVIIEPDATVWTAWPEEGSPGVVRNPKAGERESG